RARFGLLPAVARPTAVPVRVKDALPLEQRLDVKIAPPRPADAVLPVKVEPVIEVFAAIEQSPSFQRPPPLPFWALFSATIDWLIVSDASWPPQGEVLEIPPPFS